MSRFLSGPFQHVARVVNPEKGLRAMASRIVQAERDFVDVLMQRGDLTKDQAERVFDLYRREKLLRRDAVGGRYSVRHGGLLDRDVIRRAAKLEEP